jgi:hypothetical protein
MRLRMTAIKRIYPEALSAFITGFLNIQIVYQIAPPVTKYEINCIFI